MNIIADEITLTLTYDEYKKYTEGSFTDPAFKAFNKDWYIVEVWSEPINNWLLHKEYYAKFRTLRPLADKI